MQYNDFITAKLGFTESHGIDTPLRDYHLFPHQNDLAAWALRRGRAAIFADTGLGKTRIQLAWADMVARETRSDVIILAPLAVAEQTVAEGEKIGVSVTHARENADISPGINITNYDRLHKFNTDRFGAVILDESSIIKHHTSKTLQILIESFRDTPYKLCATATRLQPWQPHGQDSKDKIAVCLSCPLPDCFGTEHPECPIKRQRNRGRK